MAAISKNFGAKVIKNIGDALLFYFPTTSDSDNQTAFKEVMECCTAVIVARDFINAKLNFEGLPSVSYRVSADYGKVEVGTTVTSGVEDFFGPTVSICAKINSMAEPNGIVIGNALYQILRRFSFDDYEFKETSGWRGLAMTPSSSSSTTTTSASADAANDSGSSSINNNNIYPVYTAVRKEEEMMMTPSKKKVANLFEAVTSKPITTTSTSSSTTTTNAIHRKEGEKREGRKKIKEVLEGAGSPPSSYSSSSSSSLANNKNISIQKQKRDILTVMLVDDEPDILISLESLLVSKGFNAETFSDSYDALQSFVDSEPGYYDLIVLDIRMPSMNGLQLYKRLKTIDPNIKIIFLSALEATDELVSVLEGVKSVDVMKKPIDREHFIQKIRLSIGKPKQHCSGSDSIA
jgi:CheY-like chemotaxis protein